MQVMMLLWTNNAKLMKTIRSIILLTASLALLLSCHKERGPEIRPGSYATSRVPIQAVPYLDEGWIPMSRSASDITAIDNAQLQSRGFGLYAFYTGNESFSASKDSSAYNDFGLVLNNRQFTYSAPNWVNSGDAEFWPASAGENLSLFAYAPWDTWHGEVEYDGKVPYIVYDNYVAQNLSVAELSKQRDLLWGTTTAGVPHRDVEKNDYNPEGTVDIHFRHAPAKVNFTVRGTLSGEVLSYISSSGNSSSTGTAGDITPAAEEAQTTFDEPNVSSSITNSGNNSWLRDENYNQYRLYTCTQTWTKKEHFNQEQSRIKTETRNARYTTEGKRYLIESVSFKGFNKTGTLVLDNTASYNPQWKDITAFDSATPEYVLNSSNVLTQSLRYVNASTVQSNYNTYTGVLETPTNLMGDYYLYAIPKTVSSPSDRIKVGLTYHILNVAGTLNGSESRETIQTRTRNVERAETRIRTATRRRYRYSYAGDTTTPNSAGDFTFTEEWDDITGSVSSWTYGTWGNYIDGTPGEWVLSNPTLSGATVNYNDDTSPSLNGEIVTSFQGGRAYVINLILAGDKIELDVVPRPWDLQETVFDYTTDINDVIQALTYDSAFIDYADAQGNVYINNRMGKFYFRLGQGKYKAWQASLVGDSAFGFTDENGNFLLDGNGNRVSSIRASIDPEVMNYIYIKAINSSSTVTSRAKLRIYYIDANNDVTAALNLVNMQGVNEWTIVQNAN